MVKLTAEQKAKVIKFAKSLTEETKNSIKYAVISKDRQYIVNKSGNTNYVAKYNGDISKIALNSKKSYWESWFSNKPNSIGVDYRMGGLSGDEQKELRNNRSNLFEIIEVKVSINL